MNFGKLFDIENPVWRYLGKIWDAIWLTVLWVVCSLPVITIGAASTAVSYVALKVMKDEEGGLTKQFFHSFKQNFKQATVIWLGALLLTIILAVNFWFYYQMNNTFSKVFMIVLIVISVVFAMVMHYIFPVLAKFDNSTKNLLIMAFVMALKNVNWTVFMVVATVCVFVVGIFVFAPLLVGSIGVLAFIDAWILNHFFDKYIEENQLESRGE